ncbi:hypothetical protein OF83DRAFT_1126954 [Amylostereum chailletii]|nr:hypothetical protein OF83DRAFT_1126954 [Amylostereum chailletii]
MDRHLPHSVPLEWTASSAPALVAPRQDLRASDLIQRPDVCRYAIPSRPSQSLDPRPSPAANGVTASAVIS